MQHPLKKRPKRRPRPHLLLILTGAGVALAAAALFFLLPAIKERFPATAALPIETGPESRILYLGDSSQLESIAVSQTDGDSYTLRMQDGHLVLERGDQWLTVSDYQEESMLKAVTQLVMPGVVAEEEAEVADHLADMGLDTPRATALVRYQDGTEMTLELGGDVPTTSYAYFRWSGDDGVYMCDSGLTDALLTTATRLLPVEQPPLSKDLIDQITLSRPDGDTAVLLSNDGEGHYTGLLVEPYQYPVDSEQAEALLTALSSFRLGTREAEANAETRAQYGLDDPELTIWLHQAAGTVSAVDENGQLTTVDVEEQALRFVIGRAEGDFFYTCEYAGDCYLVSRFLLETVLAASPDTLVTRQPANLAGAALSDILIEAPQGDIHVTARYTERVLPNNDIETDADGNIVYDTAVTLNGEEADAELLTTLTTRLNALTVSGDLTDAWTVPEGETPRWRIVLTTVPAGRFFRRAGGGRSRHPLRA